MFSGSLWPNVHTAAHQGSGGGTSNPPGTSSIVQGLGFLLSGISLSGPRPCADLNEMLSHSSMYLNPGSQLGHCVGRLRRSGLVGRSVSQEVGFES